MNTVPDDPLQKTTNSQSPRDAQGDFEMNLKQQDSSKVMMIGMIVIMAVVIIGGVIAVTPKVKGYDQQKEKIAELESEMANLKQQSQTQPQLSEIQKQIEALSNQSQSGAGSEIQSKLTDLESKFDALAQQTHSSALTNMMVRIQAMQQSPEGSQILSGLVGSLAGSSNDAGESLENLRASDSNAAQLTEGVAPEDMKAAAMLLAMTQLRSSLMRDNTSFDTDLALLKKTVPQNDPALLEAIDRLAPQAKYGVLTPSGLSSEFRGMAGDIVSSSLSGQDVSLKEKAQARLADVFKVDKNGQQVSGTESQIAIAAAQKELDAGNVQGAVDILKTLQGPAAQTTQPFLQQAEATLMAGNLQNTITQSVTQNVKAGIGSLMHGGTPVGVINPYGIQGITEKVKSFAPAPAPAE